MKLNLTDLSYALIETSQDALLLVSDNGKRIDCANPAAENLLGLQAEQIQSMHLDRFLQPDSSEARQSSQQTSPAWIPQIVSGHPNLSQGVWVRRIPIDDAGTDRELIMIRAREMMRVAGITSDITHPGSTEDKPQRQLNDLAHLLRLTTLGEMVAGLTHELNQPLAAIANFAIAGDEMTSGDSPPDMERLRQILSMMRGQSARAAGIIQRIGNFASRTTRRSTVNLNAIIRDTTSLLDVDLRHVQVRLNLQLDESLPTVSVDPVMISQVLVNLIRYAMDAIQESDRSGQEHAVTITTQQLKENIEVSVLDTGLGLGQNVDRVFDAFFTTREEGMGLGLRISQLIAEAHGGRLLAANRPEGGALFRLQLPVDVSQPLTPESSSDTEVSAQPDQSSATTTPVSRDSVPRRPKMSLADSATPSESSEPVRDEKT